MVLVAVEVVSDPATIERVDQVVAQWAQDIRYCALFSGAQTGAAVAVSLDGSLHSLADALRAAHDGLTR